MPGAYGLRRKAHFSRPHSDAPTRLQILHEIRISNDDSFDIKRVAVSPDEYDRVESVSYLSRS